MEFNSGFKGLISVSKEYAVSGFFQMTPTGRVYTRISYTIVVPPRVINCRKYKLDYLLYVTDLVSHFNIFFCYITSVLFAFLLLLYVLFPP